jgi:small subunit ribosomal protein S19
VDPKLIEKISKFKPDGKTAIKTWSRACEISPEMIGYIFEVHNGKEFIPVRVTEEMIGHRLGEFSPTRKFVKHGGKIQKEMEKKSAGSK